ncbi:branched-chain amino acid ABC transporter permease [Desulfuromonas versatilis]|uniref:Branched-chain amino acid ABC transporter permease n=1 Tax=Desulfuromonas versatilis TaxID=2802975 RepID=A0ABN6DUI1_9BACT|nr:high-affinity branched-chain amino acid ABC transporter permease LivM [Desulfuromonas versatilis]BCR03782.1 branched-chain amino acid ABC transporter permease [Desulfuromonas versatilis]
MINNIKRSLGIALWFMFLTLPLMVVRVNTLKNEVEWRWLNMFWVGLGAFVLSLLWRYALHRRNRRSQKAELGEDEQAGPGLGQRLLEDPKVFRPVLIALGVVAVVFPLLFDTYQVNIMVLALIFVVLGLGLNITVGLAGLLDLGYVAFFAAGAYTYGLLNSNFGLGFWTCLPLGGIIGALLGVVLGFPILRLRGDYLAIVTLGFGSIAKIIIENWEEVFNGAKGIANIDRPGLFGADFGISEVTIYIYYLMVLLVLFTIFVTNRLKDSRIGRAWMALREDEIACVAMGIDMARTKLSAYAFGAFWAGLVGVIFAARNTYINPNSFTFMESAIVLSIVVLGGMGSIIGVIIAALVLILMPEYLRAFADYRMLVFGAVMVLMMIFRPQGLITNVRRKYEFKGLKTDEANG